MHTDACRLPASVGSYFLHHAGWQGTRGNARCSNYTPCGTSSLLIASRAVRLIARLLRASLCAHGPILLDATSCAVSEEWRMLLSDPAVHDLAPGPTRAGSKRGGQEVGRRG